MNSRITAGATVQVVSIIFPSRLNRLVCLFWISMIMKYISGVMVINMIIWAWSWMKINCSMLVVAPSLSLMLNVFIIDYNESSKTLYVEFKSNALICHAKFYVLS